MARRVPRFRSQGRRLVGRLDDGRRQLGLELIIVELIEQQRQLRRRIIRRWRGLRAVVKQGAFGAYGAYGAYGALGAGALCTLISCSYLPAGRERAQAEEILRAEQGVVSVEISCGTALLAGDQLCVDVVADDGARIRFEHVGFRSFGATAVNVMVAEAGGLVPRIASCSGVTAPNFHREGPLGHHFSPSLIDLKEAVTRRREVLEEVQYWPQCPQYWDVQDKRGQNYRYCARKRDATDEPPRPENCAQK